MPDSDQKFYRTSNIPKTVRDGAVAAAIGVSLTLAMQAPTSRQVSPAPVDSPWTYSTRDRIMYTVSDWQNQDSWGSLSGWGSGPGKWRSRPL